LIPTSPSPMAKHIPQSCRKFTQKPRFAGIM
jgi:hypothetical protein